MKKVLIATLLIGIFGIFTHGFSQSEQLSEADLQLAVEEGSLSTQAASATWCQGIVDDISVTRDKVYVSFKSTNWLLMAKWGDEKDNSIASAMVAEALTAQASGRQLRVGYPRNSGVGPGCATGKANWTVQANYVRMIIR